MEAVEAIRDSIGLSIRASNAAHGVLIHEMPGVELRISYMIYHDTLYK